jgi:hypothetical protein
MQDNHIQNWETAEFHSQKNQIRVQAKPRSYLLNLGEALRKNHEYLIILSL